MLHVMIMDFPINHFSCKGIVAVGSGRAAWTCILMGGLGFHEIRLLEGQEVVAISPVGSDAHSRDYQIIE